MDGSGPGHSSAVSSEAIDVMSLLFSAQAAACKAPAPLQVLGVSLSDRASPSTAGPLSSKMGYIRAGLGCLGAALKQHGDVVQGRLAISKTHESRWDRGLGDANAA